MIKKMQNLVVSNDKDATYVQFGVNIPDGYDTFKIDYLNGSIINQNYLNVGDKIQFEFDNKPLVYDNVKLQPKLIYNTGTARNEASDNRAYEYIKFDVFRYYKLVFIPIYAFYQSNSHYVYLFNPCRADQLLSEPKKYIPPIQVSDFRGATRFYQVSAAFTGTYLLGLKPVDKLPPIDVVIGESIGNSKTRPQDLGSYSIQAEAINDIRSQTIQTTAYNYGSAWTYPINNLIMKHQESFRYEPSNKNQTPNMSLIYAIDGKTTFLPVSVCSVVNGQIPSLNMTFKRVLQIEPPIKDLRFNFILPTQPKQGLISPFMMKNADTNEFYLIQDEEGFERTGAQLKDESDTNPYYFIESPDTAPTITSFKSKRYINPDWTYTTNNFQILVGVRGHGSTAPFKYSNELTGDGLMMNTETPGTVPVLITFDKTGEGDDDYYNMTYTTEKNKPPAERIKLDVIFKVFDDNAQDYIFSNQFSFWLIGSLNAENKHEPDDHKFSVITSINTGYITPAIYDLITPEFYNKPLQLTNNETAPASEQRTLNPEDLLISAERENGKYGLKFRLKEQATNIIHNLTYTNTSDQPTITNTVYKWFHDGIDHPDSRDMDILAFIPLKTNRPLTAFSPDANSNLIHWQCGFFYVKTLDGADTDELTDSNVEVFLSGGHESLNVEPPNEDDAKFKTFNGSLTFDRSDARITRLFSNDITGACLGYLNDILSAKLSRYYYVSSLNIFNAFLATQSKLIINNNPKALNANYKSNTLYCGAHETVFCSCFDVVKLIGSENVVNNCLSSLQPEQQAVPANVWTYDELMDDAQKEHLKDASDIFYYKFFHFYNSALNEEPHNGYGVNDSPTTTIGGLNIIKCDGSILSCNIRDNSRRTNIVNTTKPFYIMSGDTAYYNLGQLKTDLNKNTIYNTNRNLLTDGYAETLPAYRIYKNANFEQSDLTITTGGIKTLHPIYVQSTPKILINNILYLADFVINYVLGTFGDINREEDKFGYIHVLTCQTDRIDHLPLNGSEFPLFRFGKVVKRTYEGETALSMSFDSLFLLNYINTDSLNEYRGGVKEIKESIPGAVNNEEILSNIKTTSATMNVQLFSKQYFDFLDGVNDFSMVVLKFQYIEQMIFNDSVFELYYNTSKIEEKGQQLTITQDIAKQTTIQNLVASFLNNISSFNNLKTSKILIIKIGEFLQFPKILYGVSDTFSNSLNVSVSNYNNTNYVTPFQPSMREIDDAYSQQKKRVEDIEFKPQQQQKINVYLFGVMFRYHQLALGYQNLNNEIPTDFVITKGLGNRHFVLTIVDEFGRRIPNVDTSQGFKNNLYLEITLETMQTSPRPTGMM